VTRDDFPFFWTEAVIKRLLQLCFSSVRVLFRQIGRRFTYFNRSKSNAYRHNQLLSHHRSKDHTDRKAAEAQQTNRNQDDHIIFSIPRDEVVRALNQTLWRTASQENSHVEAAAESSEYADHPDFIQSLADSAYICDCQGRYAEAERLYQQVLSLTQRHYGEGHSETANGLSDLAAFYCEQQRHSEAEPVLIQLLKVRSQAPLHPPAVADALFRLGELYRHQLQLKQAEPYLQRALSILLETFGPEDSRTRSAQFSLSQIYTD